MRDNGHVVIMRSQSLEDQELLQLPVKLAPLEAMHAVSSALDCLSNRLHAATSRTAWYGLRSPVSGHHEMVSWASNDLVQLDDVTIVVALSSTSRMCDRSGR